MSSPPPPPPSTSRARHRRTTSLLPLAPRVLSMCCARSFSPSLHRRRLVARCRRARARVPLRPRVRPLTARASGRSRAANRARYARLFAIHVRPLSPDEVLSLVQLTRVPVRFLFDQVTSTVGTGGSVKSFAARKITRLLRSLSSRVKLSTFWKS